MAPPNDNANNSWSPPRNSPPIPGQPPAGPAVTANGRSRDGKPPRKIVVFREGRSNAALAQIQNSSGLSDVAAANNQSFDPVQAKNAQIIHWPRLGAAVLNAASADQMSRVSSLAGQDNSDIQFIFDEGEYLLTNSATALAPSPTPAPAPVARSYSVDYLDGMIEALTLLREGKGDALNDRIRPKAGHADFRAAAAGDQFRGTAEATWGINAMGVATSRYTGRGIKVAIIDSGFDSNHPDFAGRNPNVKSFTGLDGSDFNGHGTHCVGIACGGKDGDGVRYGVASDADIYVGQVFDNTGHGYEQDIINALEWALSEGCHLVSMSLERTPNLRDQNGNIINPGNPVRVGESYKDTYYGQAYEELAARAIRAGTLLIAAAGNDSYRPGQVFPVNQPAFCPSIIAVGALKSNLQVAGFSNGAANNPTNLDGGRIDFAAPGEGIWSSWPRPIAHRYDTGTSMATPFVAGLAALIAEQTGLRGYPLWWKLSEAARGFGLDAGDVGFGMPIAPQ